jgi:hypothetical protein
VSPAGLIAAASHHVCDADDRATGFNGTWVTPVTHAEPSPQAAIHATGCRNDWLRDELLLGVAQRQVLLAAAQAHERVPKLMTDDVDATR